MLFNSYIFIFVFLPVCLLSFYSLQRIGGAQWSLYGLLIFSLFFYSWWNPTYLTLLLASAVVNFYIGECIAKKNNTIYYLIGIVINLVTLGYFKYFNFFVDNINHFFNSGIEIEKILLPLAISFFTFQQIAYLSSCHKTGLSENKFSRYLLFICFFPQLIAGPIVNHSELIKQFSTKKFGEFNRELFSVGVCIFIIGLAKKLILADPLANYVDPVFLSASEGGNLSNADSWMALTSYKFQLYFDFSSYADMAIGLGLMFGIRLPVNFESPYKATNMFEFWNRWHTTLARFMRNHLYRPLARAFRFPMGVQIALIVNIMIGGIWHGANWNFLLWGIFNGFLLVINHAYRKSSQKLLPPIFKNLKAYSGICIVITFFFTMLSSVMFRSDNLISIQKMFTNLFVANNYPTILAVGILDYLFIAALSCIIWFFPNTWQIFKAFKPGISLVRDTKPAFIKYSIKNIGWKHGFILGLIFFICLIFLSNEKEFIYFQF